MVPSFDVRPVFLMSTILSRGRRNPIPLILLVPDWKLIHRAGHITSWRCQIGKWALIKCRLLPCLEQWETVVVFQCDTVIRSRTWWLFIAVIRRDANVDCHDLKTGLCAKYHDVEQNKMLLGFVMWKQDIAACRGNRKDCWILLSAQFPGSQSQWHGVVILSKARCWWMRIQDVDTVI